MEFIVGKVVYPLMVNMLFVMQSIANHLFFVLISIGRIVMEMVPQWLKTKPRSSVKFIG